MSRFIETDQVNPHHKLGDPYEGSGAGAQHRFSVNGKEQLGSGKIEYGSFDHFALWQLYRHYLAREYDDDAYPTWGANEDSHTRFLEEVYEWPKDEETARHLDPLPYIEDSTLAAPKADSMVQMLKYYLNMQKGFDEDRDPFKIQTMTASMDGRPAGIATMRFGDDAYIASDEARQVAGLERLIVNPDPDFRRKGIGAGLSLNGCYYAFHSRGYEKVVAWVMADELSGNYHINMNMFEGKLGFEMRKEYSHWSEYCADHDIDSEGREAFWYELTKDKFSDMLMAGAYDKYLPQETASEWKNLHHSGIIGK